MDAQNDQGGITTWNGSDVMVGYVSNDTIIQLWSGNRQVSQRASQQGAALPVCVWICFEASHHGYYETEWIGAKAEIFFLSRKKYLLKKEEISAWAEIVLSKQKVLLR